MTGPARVCAGCGAIFAGAHDHVRCARCYATWRRLRDHESGFRAGWQAAVTRMGLAVDRQALAEALEELRRQGASR